MANGNIKGIVIEIGADIQPLDNALKDVNKQAKNLQSELKEVERGLKLDPGNVELVRQKQRLLTQSIEATSDKLHVLRQAQGQVEQQFRNGEIGEEQYRAFRRELVNTENNMRSLRGQLNSLQSDQQRLTETTRSLGAFFDATGTNVEEFAGTLGTRLTQAIRNGTASADQMERALRLMGRQALGAGTDIDEMRRVLNQINSGSSIDDIRTELQQMNTVVVTTQDELKEIDKLLKFNPNNVELLAQKQALLTRSIQDTSTELQQLQQRQSQVEAQFQNGQIGEEQYRAFRREIEQAEQSLTGYQNQLNAMQQEQQQLQSSTRQMQTLFNATGTSVDQFADVLGNDLVRAIQEGRASSVQIEQAINQIGRASLGAGQDLEEFRNALRNADNGAPIDEIRQDLERLRQDADQATGSVNNLDKGMDALGDGATAAAAGVAALGAAAGLSAAQFDNATGQIQAALGVTREEAEALEDSAKNVWKAGFGESLEDVSAALIRVKQNIKGIDDGEVEIITKNALSLAKAFDSDVNEVTRGARGLMTGFGIDAKTAFDSMAKGAQSGLNFSNDLFDQMAEFGPLWGGMGFSIEEMFGKLVFGAESGAYQLDYLNDIMKEYEVKTSMMDKSTVDAFASMSKAAQDTYDSFLKGEITLAQLNQVVSKELGEMDDKTAAFRLGVDILGTKFEDLGQETAMAFLTSQNAMSDFEGAMNSIAEVQEQTFGQRWESFTRTAAASLEPLGKILLDLAEQWLPKIITAVEGVAKWFADLTPTMQGVTVGIGAIMASIGPLIMIAGGLISSIGSIIGLFTSGGIAAGAFSAVIAAMTGPIGLAVAAVAGIGVAVGILANDLSQSSIEVEGWKGKVSEATAESLGSFMDLSENATVAFNQLSWSGQAVTQEMATNLISIYDQMGQQVLAEMQTDHATQLETLRTFYANSKSLTEEEEAQILAKTEEYRANQEQRVKEGNARIQEMLTAASNEKRALTLAEQAEINSIQELMKENAIKYMSESEREQKVILENLKNEATEISAEQAAEVVRNSVKQKDEVVKEATDQYDKVVAEIIKQRDELGVITAEQAQKLIEEAQKQRDGTVKSAEEMHTNVVAEAKAQADEHVKQVDWTTGEVKSKWQVMKDNTVAKMKELGSAIKRDWTNAYNDTVKSVGNIVSSVGKFFSDKVKTVETKMAEVKKKVESKWGEVTAFLKGIDLIQIGKDIVNGLITGIGNRFGNVKKKIEELAGLIPEWAKDILDIHSPSRVFIEIGEFLIAGLTKGIGDGKAELKKASEMMAEAIIPDIKPATKEALKEFEKFKGDVAKRINDINGDYLSKVKDLNTNLIKEEQKLNDEYKKSVESRAKTLYNFAGLFEDFNRKFVDSEDLVNNLAGQVKAFEIWEREITALSKKAIDEGLLAELRNMGPDAVSEVQAINRMTDEQLSYYVDLWRDKSRMAREQAIDELSGMKTSTIQTIQTMRSDADKQLQEYQKQWQESMKGIVSTIEFGTKEMKAAGKEIANGMVAGIKSQESHLINVAKQMANTVADTVRKELDIHSPSRVFEEIGVWTVEGFVLGVESKMTEVTGVAQRLAKGATDSLKEAQKVLKDTALMTVDDLDTRSKNNYAAIFKAAYSDYHYEDKEFMAALRNELRRKGVSMNDDILQAFYMYGAEMLDDLSIRKKLLAEASEIQTKLMGDSFETQKDYLEKMQGSGKLSLEEQLQIYKMFADQYGEHTEQYAYFSEKIIDINDAIADSIQKQYDSMQETINDAVSEIDVFADALMGALSNKYKMELDVSIANSDAYFDKIINPLLAAQNALQEQFANEDRTDTMSGLRASLVNARTEADRKRIQEKIAAEEKQWSREQQLNTIAAEIEKAQKAKEEAARGIKEKYEALTKQEAVEHEARKLLVENNEKEIIDLLESYNPDWQDAGQSFGEKLIFGLNSMKNPIQKVVGDMVNLMHGTLAAEIEKLQFTLRNGINLEASFQKLIDVGSAFKPINVPSAPNISIASQPIVLHASIDLDGERVATQTFNYTNDLLGASATNNMRYAGVKK